jgi:hypothetical protein
MTCSTTMRLCLELFAEFLFFSAVIILNLSLPEAISHLVPIQVVEHVLLDLRTSLELRCVSCIAAMFVMASKDPLSETLPIS